MAYIEFNASLNPPDIFDEELLIAVDVYGEIQVMRGRYTTEGWWTYAEVDLSNHSVIHWVKFDDAVIVARKELN